MIVFLNPDTVVMPGAVGRLARRLEDSAIGIAMARLQLLDRPGILNSGGTVVHVSGLAWAGRFGQQTFERVVVNGLFVGGTTGIVKAGSAAARALQNGFLRAYAALLVLGLVGVALYFLLQSS